jgi:hypothetical protein
VLTKSLGTTNPINLVRATVAGLQELKTPQQLARLRGLTVRQVLGMDAVGAEAMAAEKAERAEKAEKPAAEAAEKPAAVKAEKPVVEKFEKKVKPGRPTRLRPALRRPDAYAVATGDQADQERDRFAAGPPWHLACLGHQAHAPHRGPGRQPCDPRHDPQSRVPPRGAPGDEEVMI